MNRRVSPLILNLVAFALAYATSVFATLVFVRALAMPLFAGGASSSRGGYLIFLAPLGGLALFQLLFGLTGRWRGFGFWRIAPLIVYGILLLCWQGLIYGQLTAIMAIWLAVGLVALAGVAALFLSDSSD